MKIWGYYTKKSRALSRVEVYILTKNIYKRALIAKTGVHMLRHTKARNMVNSGINLVSIQETLGHSDIKTTAIYAK
jgi:site-specific recombinase XerD